MFGFVTQGDRWIPFEWGWDVLSYAMYSIGSSYGSLQLLVVLFVLLIVGFELDILRRLSVGPLGRIISILFLLFTCLIEMQVRPYLVTTAGLVVVLWFLIRHRIEGGSSRLIYFLPLVFLIWTNMHPGVLAGMALTGLFLIEEVLEFVLRETKWKANRPVSVPSVIRLLIVFTLSGGALLINPHGLETYRYVIDHTHLKLLPVIREWLPPFSHEIDTRVVWFYWVVVVLGGVTSLVSLIKKRFLPGILYGAFLLLSLRALRFISNFAVVTIPFAVVGVKELIYDRLNPQMRMIIRRAAYPLIILGMAGIAWTIYSGDIYQFLEYHRHFGVGPDRHYFSLPLITYMKQNRIYGRPFNQNEIGGELLWELPGETDFIDSRNLNDDIWREYYAINGKNPGFAGMLDRYGVDHIVVFLTELVRNPSLMEGTLIPYCTSEPNEWKLVYWDDRSLLFLRNIPRFERVIAADSYTILNPYYFAYEHGRFDSLAVAFPETFRRELNRKLRDEPDGFLTQAFAEYGRMRALP